MGGLLPGSGAEPPAEREPETVVIQPVSFDEIPGWTTPYEVVGEPWKLPAWVDPGSFQASGFMDATIKQIVKREGPIHMNLLDARLREAWGIGRIGKNIRDNINAAIVKAQVLRDRAFLLEPGAETRVRTPTYYCQRSVAQVHERELDLALANIVSDAGGISSEELMTTVTRIYGWELRGSDITAALRIRIDSLVDRGVFTGNLDHLAIGDRH
jgi:hypothetical protein